MGQIHSEEYQLDKSIEDVGDSELNTQNSTQDGVKGTDNELKQSSKSSNIKSKQEQQQQQHVRKLSNVSHRNIQLLSMKPQSEKEAYVDGLRARRRSSLINLILGAPSSGPRFSDDLCSLSSNLSNFGIEFFPDTYQNATSISSLRSEASTDNQDTERSRAKIEGFNATKSIGSVSNQKRRRSSLGSLAAQIAQLKATPGDNSKQPTKDGVAPSAKDQQSKPRQKLQQFRNPSLSSMLASIDLTSSFEQHDKSNRGNIATLSGQYQRPPPLYKTRQTIFESVSQESINEPKAKNPKERLNLTGRVLRRTGSELSLYSTVSGASVTPSQRSSVSSAGKHQSSGVNLLKETKLIIMLQVCLPFILAGFGNMAAGLVLNKVAHWHAFRQVPTFFVLLPSFVGLKGNIEMTLASRLSTLSNLNLLTTTYQRKRAYLSNLVLILSQAIGLSVFASVVAILCEVFISDSKFFTNLNELFRLVFLVVLASALATAMLLVVLSSIIMSLSIGLANYIQVNPDNLSTLIAALYGDVSCVFVYGLIADWMFSLHERGLLLWPSLIVGFAFVIWPILLYVAYSLKETKTIALSAIPPMLVSIMISMGSGAVLSVVVGRFKLIALYQPVVNGFGANLIAVQASRVSTWLWCSALRRISSVSAEDIEENPKKLFGSLASFTDPIIPIANNDKKPPGPNLLKLAVKVFKTILWSFFNSSPNSIAARLLLLMLIPAHSLYFLVIWLVSSSNYVVITPAFYLIYIGLCLLQVFILLTICEPLMTLFMKRHLDPDIFGISILMALADLIGTLCLTGAFLLLASLGDINAVLK